MVHSFAIIYCKKGTIMNNRSLKNYILDFNNQLKIVFFFLLVNIITIVALYFAASEFYTMFVSKGIELGIPKNHIFYSFLDNLHTQMLSSFLRNSLISTFIIVIGAIIISHNLSGPMYRIKKEFKEMSKNKAIHPFKFRKKDKLEDLERYIQDIYDAQK